MVVRKENKAGPCWSPALWLGLKVALLAQSWVGQKSPQSACRSAGGFASPCQHDHQDLHRYSIIPPRDECRHLSFNILPSPQCSGKGLWGSTQAPVSAVQRGSALELLHCLQLYHPSCQFFITIGIKILLPSSVEFESLEHKRMLLSFQGIKLSP